jgi:hypothetical protein
MRSFVTLFCVLFLTPMLSMAEENGGTYEQELTQLTADLSKRLDEVHLKTVAAVDFKDLQGKTTNLGRFLSDEVSTNLAMQDKNISMADRANLKRIMEENKLTEEGLVNPENAKKLGQLAGLDAIMFGTVVPFGNGYRVNVKVIATDTAKIVVASRGIFSKSDTLDSLAGVTGVMSDTSDSTSDTPPTPKQRKFSIGDVLIEIKSVEYFKKGRKVRVLYSVLWTPPPGGYYTHPPAFAYHTNDLTPQGNQVPDAHLIGKATDDNGATYGIITPVDALSQPKLSTTAPLVQELEYQIAEAHASAQIPEKVSFWFEFYVDQISNPNYLFKLSTADYAIDKIR